MESKQWLKLDANEGRCVLDDEQLARALSPEIARRYPRAESLERDLAEQFAIAPELVIATAGADDAIDRAFRALAGPGSRIVSTVPGFVEFLDASARCGAEFIGFPLTPGEDLPASAFAEFIQRVKPAMAVIAAPDNPAGTILSAEGFKTVAAACARAGSVFLLDLTYLDFADDRSLFQLAEATPGVLLTGSFSKSRGLAGFRAGWAVAGPHSASLISALREAGPPFSLSSPAIEAAKIALRETQERYAAFVSRIAEERETLRAVLTRLGAKVWPSQANFVSAFVPDAADFVAALRNSGILVRYWPGKEDCKGLVRITCPGDPEEFGRLIGALEEMEALAW